MKCSERYFLLSYFLHTSMVFFGKLYRERPLSCLSIAIRHSKYFVCYELLFHCSICMNTCDFCFLLMIIKYVQYIVKLVWQEINVIRKIWVYKELSGETRKVLLLNWVIHLHFQFQFLILKVNMCILNCLLCVCYMGANKKRKHKRREPITIMFVYLLCVCVGRGVVKRILKHKIVVICAYIQPLVAFN